MWKTMSSLSGRRTRQFVTDDQKRVFWSTVAADFRSNRPRFPPISLRRFSALDGEAFPADGAAYIFGASTRNWRFFILTSFISNLSRRRLLFSTHVSLHGLYAGTVSPEHYRILLLVFFTLTRFFTLTSNSSSVLSFCRHCGSVAVGFQTIA